MENNNIIKCLNSSFNHLMNSLLGTSDYYKLYTCIMAIVSSQPPNELTIRN